MGIHYNIDHICKTLLEATIGENKHQKAHARQETKLLEAAVNGEKSNGGERAALLTSGRVLMEGGVPIIDPAHGRIIGACGVSGVKPNEDAEVAKAAVNGLLQQSKL